MKVFYPQGPRPDMEMPGEEKARRARTFRRRAALADLFAVLFAVLVLILAFLGLNAVGLPDPLLFALLAAILLSMAGSL